MSFPIYAWVLVTVIALLDCVVIGMHIEHSLFSKQHNSNEQKGESDKNLK
jgi:uncharacterized protein YneF (UPF0154 family)